MVFRKFLIEKLHHEMHNPNDRAHSYCNKLGNKKEINKNDNRKGRKRKD